MFGFIFYLIFSLEKQKPTQMVCVSFNVSATRVCGPRHLHYGSDYPKCDFHAAFQKKTATNPSLPASRSVACPPESLPPQILPPRPTTPLHLRAPICRCRTDLLLATWPLLRRHPVMSTSFAVRHPYSTVIVCHLLHGQPCAASFFHPQCQ
jgi:hypothetical protein